MDDKFNEITKDVVQNKDSSDENNVTFIYFKINFTNKIKGRK